MGNIVQIKQGNDYVLQNTLEKKEVLIEEAYKVLQANSFEHAVPFQVTQEKGKRVITMNLTDTYSFLVRLQHPIDSRELVIMVKGLLDAIKFLASKKIPPTLVDLDLDYIFIRKDGKVLLTMWIIKDLQPKTTIPLLFKQIGDLAKPHARKDKNFIDGYLQLFDTDFNLEKLDAFITDSYNMLKQSVGESIASTGVQYNEKTSYNEPAKQPVKEEVKPKPVPNDVWEDDDDDDDIMLPASAQTTLLSMDEEEEDYGATTILSETVQVERYLVSSKGDRYDISNGENIIGKSGADINITGNQAISRTHAKITVFDGEVTLEDLNSSNGTKHMGKKLERGETPELVSGDTVTFANEDFTYEEA